MRTFPIPALALLVLPAAGCLETEDMTGLEALQALGEVNQSARGEQATADVIEISTDFTIGEALEAAAQTIAEFWESQAPCTEVTVDGPVTTIDYGTLDDDCTFNGKTFAGVNTITIGSTNPGDLEVEHGWNGFTNGDVTVDGGALVTWSGEDDSRHVVTEHTWSDNADGTTVDVFGDHVTAPLEAGVRVWESGFTLDGSREWTSETGDWTLDMTDLELRLIDPAPQWGTIGVTNPDGKSVEIVYDRVDETTIQATLTGLRGGDRVYHITALGQIEEVEAGE